MITRLVPLAWFAIDADSLEARANTLADQEQIDPQTEVAPKRRLTVVPPRVGTTISFQFPIGIKQSEVEQAPKRCAFRC